MNCAESGCKCPQCNLALIVKMQDHTEFTGIGSNCCNHKLMEEQTNKEVINWSELNLDLSPESLRTLLSVITYLTTPYNTFTVCNIMHLSFAIFELFAHLNQSVKSLGNPFKVT